MNKIIIFIYGIVSYIIFLVAFLYAIGFVGDFIVPKTINSGVETSFFKSLVINIALLTVFALQHSIMARPAFKSWWTKFVHPAIERSTYVLFSSLALILIYWQWRPMTEVVWEVQNPIATGIIYGVFAMGWLTVLLSTFMINHFDLFGLKQVYEYLQSLNPKPIPFKMSFLYGVIRHPIMLGYIIAFWAIPVMTVGHLIFSLTTTLYILVAINFLEERDLRKVHGEKYEAYQKKVPMLIPYSGGNG